MRILVTGATGYIGSHTCVELLNNDYDTPDGTCIRDYIHVVDLADIMLMLLRHTKS